jgi:hypothetical protein
VTRQATTAQAKGYQKAEDEWARDMHQADADYAKALRDGVDPATAQQAHIEAQGKITAKREAAKALVAKEYDAAVRSIGGTPGSQAMADNPPAEASLRVKDPNGKLIGYVVNRQFVPLGQ